MAKTVEELQAEFDSYKSETEGILSKNKELLDEVKKLKRSKEENNGDLTKYYELQDKYDALKDEKTKLEHDFKKTSKSLETVMSEKDGLTNKLTTLIVDNGLTGELSKAGVKPEYMEATQALLRDKVQLVEDKAMVGDKSLDEFMKEWATTDGKAFVKAPENGGAGAGGGSGGGGIDKNLKPGTKEYDLAKAKELIEKR